MKVNTDNARLRQAPSTDSPILATLPFDTTLVQLDRPWVRVSATYSNSIQVEGWIALDLTDDYSIAPPPTDHNQEQVYSLEELWPLFSDGFPPKVLAAIAYQESGFKNYRVHHDQTGHGLFGLDDNGLLPDFEQYTGIKVGRGPTANIIPIEPQIEYARAVLTKYSTKYGGPYNAARVWHRGEGQWQDARGDNYEALIRAHEQTLFPS